MPDYFALLTEPRRPWLDENVLKSRFLQLSAGAHPDRSHDASEAEKQLASQRFAELNAAYNCLREPKSRLRHLSELESGSKLKEIQKIPPDAMAMFFEVGQLCREVDAFLTQNAAVTSPLVKVEVFERGQEWTDKLNEVQRKVNAKLEVLSAELKQLNPAWENAPPEGAARLNSLPMKQLESLGREFSYLARWSGQIQDRIVRLSL